jgi:hypothetical protein
MRVIFSGSRHVWLKPDDIDRLVIESGFVVHEAVCGCADGVDKSVGHCQVGYPRRWVKAGECREHPLSTHGWACLRGKLVAHFPAEWGKYGRAAGPVRNGEMAEYARQDEGGACLAVPALDSVGTWDMITQAKARDLLVHVARPPRLTAPPAAATG